MPELSEKDNISIIEDELNKYLEKIINDYYYTVIKIHNIDIGNLSDRLSSRYLTLESFKKINWNDIYKDSFYTVNVKSNLTSGLYSNK